MSVQGELQRYLESSIELLSSTAEKNLLDDLVSARRGGEDDVVTRAESILETFARHAGLLDSKAGSALSTDAIESLDRLRSLCGIILGR